MSGWRDRPSGPPGAVSAQVLALQLLGRWTRIAQGHIPIGAACSCGSGGSGAPMSLSAASLEPDLMAWLSARFESRSTLRSLFALAAGDRSGAALPASAGTQGAPTVTCGLAELLTRVARSRRSGDDIGALLARIDASLESFERAHAGTP